MDDCDGHNSVQVRQAPRHVHGEGKFAIVPHQVQVRVVKDAFEVAARRKLEHEADGRIVPYDAEEHNNVRMMVPARGDWGGLTRILFKKSKGIVEYSWCQ